MIGTAAHALRAHRRLVLLVPVCLLALTVRLWAVYEYLPECPVLVDRAETTLAQCFEPEGGRGYIEGQARALSAGDGFVSPGMASGGESTPGARHLPLFPVLLGIVDRMGYEDLNAHRVATALLGTFGVFLMGIAARVVAVVGRDRAMVVAGSVAAVFPPFWVNDANLQPEALLVPLSAFAIITAYRALRRPSWGRFAALGVAAGLLALTRLDGLVLGAGLITASAVLSARGEARFLRLRRAAVSAGVGALLLTPWVVHNLNQFSRPVALTTGVGPALLAGTCDATWSGAAIGSYDPSCLPPRWTAFEDDDNVAARSAAASYASTHVSEVPQVVAARVARLWGLFAPIDTAEREDLLEGRGASAGVVGFAALAAVLLGAVAGALHLRRRDIPISPFLLLVLVPTVSAAVTFAVVRVRAPADVALVVLASVGLAAATRRWTLFPTVGTGSSNGFRRLAPLLVVVIAALGLRLFVMAHVTPECTSSQQERGDVSHCYVLSGDPLQYDGVGVGLALGRGFTWAAKSTAQHPPAFYVEVAVLDRIGLESFTSKRVGFAVVGSLGVLLVGLVGYRLGGRRGPLTGTLAGGLAAFSPVFVSNDLSGKAESLYLIVAMLALLGTYRLLRRPSLGNAALLGAAIGAAWLTRTEAVLFLVFAAVPVLQLHAVPRGRRIALVATIVAVAVVCVAPWVLRNRSTFEQPVLFTTNVGQTLVLGACDDVFSGEAVGWYSLGCFPDDLPAGSTDESLVDRYYRDQAVAYADEHRSQIPSVAAARLARMWHLYRPLQTISLDGFAEGRNYGSSLTILLTYLVSLPLAAVGLWDLRKRRIQIVPLVGLFVAVSAVAVAAAPVLRYRVPADAALMVLAAVAVVRVAYGTDRRSDEGEP